MCIYIIIYIYYVLYIRRLLVVENSTNLVVAKKKGKHKMQNKMVEKVKQ